MSETNRQRVRRLFLELEQLAEAERPAALARWCGDDAALRAEVEALLKADVEAGAFLSSPTADGGAHRAAAAVPAQEQTGAQIGRYKLLEQIGEGGMGTIWMAEQREPVKRRVALKIIKLGMDTKQVIARFEAERQALAMMDHPHIAKVLDAGATETGRPYFVMEYIRGIPILEYCDKEKFDTQARLELFTKVCHAIQHAHQKGIIHRDIKPSNVLVTLHDGVPMPKVIDFGIAKATNSELTTKTLFTEHRQLVGTPAYMSPEQAEMSGLDIDTRSDVYSLGVLLYELLTGTTPFDMKALLESGYAEMLRAIREDEPHKPSTRISSLGDTGTRTAQQRRVEVKKLSLLLRGDLDWIVMKCLEKDRSRRYDTANGLAADIARHLHDEPVSAGAPSAGYKLRKFVKRNRGAVLAGALVVVALVLGMIGTGVSLQRAVRAESNVRTQLTATETAQKAEKARADELEKVSDFQASMLAQVDPTTAGVRLSEDVNRRFAAALERESAPLSERARLADAFRQRWASVNATDAATALIDATILKPAVKAIEGQFGEQPLVQAQLRQTLANRYRDLGLYDAALPLQESALAARRRLLGEEHRETMRSIHEFGLLLLEQGKLAQAEPYYREALEKSLRLRGEEHPDTLVCQSSMGALLLSQGKLAEAEPYLRETLESLRRVQGDEHPDTLFAINGMALLRQEQGRFAESEALFREALEKSRRVLGEQDPSTVLSISNLATLLQARGKLAEAEPYVREVLEKKRRMLGEEHPSTLGSIHNMGVLLQAQGKLAEAEPYAREAFEKLRRVLGPDHPETIGALSSLAVLLQMQGRFREAEPYSREALEKSRLVLGEDHSRTIVAMGNLAALLEDLGELAESERCTRAVLEMHRRAVGDDHPDTLTARNNLAVLLIGQGRLAEAEVHCRETLERRRRVLGDEHAETLASFIQLGVLLEDQGHPAEAEACFRGASEKARRTLGDEHPLTLATVYEIGRVLHVQGKLADAEPLLREALEARRRVLGEEHTETLASITGLGSLLLAQGRLDEAEPYLREGLEKNRRVRGEANRETLTSLNNLGSLLQKQGKLAEAEPLLRAALEQRRQLLGEEHRDTLMSLANLGTLLQDQGKFDEAEAYYREALEKSRRVLGPEHSDTLSTLNNLGSLLFFRGELDGAEPLLREALEKRRQLFGDDHPSTINSIANLGTLLLTKKKLAEAEPLLAEVVERRLRLYPTPNASTATLLRIHAAALLGLERRDEAAARERQALAIERRLGPRGSPELGGGLASFASKLLERGTLEAAREAETLLRECLELRLETMPNDWRVHNTRSLLGGALLASAELDAALAPDARGARMREAEKLVLDGYAGLKDNPAVPTPEQNGGADRRREALARVVHLYEVWDKADPGQDHGAQAAEWKEKR